MFEFEEWGRAGGVLGVRAVFWREEQRASMVVRV